MYVWTAGNLDKQGSTLFQSTIAEQTALWAKTGRELVQDCEGMFGLPDACANSAPCPANTPNLK